MKLIAVVRLIVVGAALPALAFSTDNTLWYRTPAQAWSEALPVGNGRIGAAWPQGSVSGLRARGGFVVAETWQDGALTGATVRSEVGGPCVLRSRGPFKVISGNVILAHSAASGPAAQATFTAGRNELYTIRPENSPR